jgi:hypothetical protein
MLIVKISHQSTIRINTGTVHLALISNLSEQSEELDTTNWQISTLAHWQISTLRGQISIQKTKSRQNATLQGLNIKKQNTKPIFACEEPTAAN